MGHHHQRIFFLFLSVSSLLFSLSPSPSLSLFSSLTSSACIFSEWSLASPSYARLFRRRAFCLPANFSRSEQGPPLLPPRSFTTATACRMPFFSRVFRSKDPSKKSGRLNGLPLEPEKPKWTDAWLRTEVEPEEVVDLLLGCTSELKDRGIYLSSPRSLYLDNAFV